MCRSFVICDQKLSLPNLTEITIAGNPVCRRSHYRAHLIFNNASLQSIDDKKVLPDEKEKAQFLAETPEPPKIIPQVVPPNKVPLKMNYMNFDAMVKNGINQTINTMEFFGNGNCTSPNILSYVHAAFVLPAARKPTFYRSPKGGSPASPPVNKKLPSKLNKF